MVTITNHLTSDHKFCDDLFLKFRNTIDNGDFILAKSYFKDFFTAINLHIKIEEEILFPKFKEVTDIIHCPTNVMELEHIEINKFLKKINFTIGKNNNILTPILNDFLNILNLHSKKEEQILYPMCDERISKKDILLLLDKMDKQNIKYIK